jgi:hypothetical protein
MSSTVQSLLQLSKISRENHAILEELKKRPASELLSLRNNFSLENDKERILLRAHEEEIATHVVHLETKRIEDGRQFIENYRYFDNLLDALNHWLLTKLLLTQTVDGVDIFHPQDFLVHWIDAGDHRVWGFQRKSLIDNSVRYIKGLIRMYMNRVALGRWNALMEASARVLRAIELPPPLKAVQDGSPRDDLQRISRLEFGRHQVEGAHQNMLYEALNYKTREELRATFQLAPLTPLYLMSGMKPVVTIESEGVQKSACKFDGLPDHTTFTKYLRATPIMQLNTYGIDGCTDYG